MLCRKKIDFFPDDRQTPGRYIANKSIFFANKSNFCVDKLNFWLVYTRKKHTTQVFFLCRQVKHEQVRYNLLLPRCNSGNPVFASHFLKMACLHTKMTCVQVAFENDLSTHKKWLVCESHTQGFSCATCNNATTQPMTCVEHQRYLITFRNVMMCGNSVEMAGAEFAGCVGALQHQDSHTFW